MAGADVARARHLATTIPGRFTSLGERLPAEDRAELTAIVADLYEMMSTIASLSDG